MRYLLLSSFLFTLGCTPLYKNLQKIPADPRSVLKFKPEFAVALYKAEVNVTGHYLGGLLLIKKMPDSSLRMVFSSEVGLTFFDFGFLKSGSFQVYSIIKLMDRKPVIKTLRKDFELILMQQPDLARAFVCTDTSNGELYYVFPRKKGFNYYITDSTGNELLGMERASKSKRVVTAIAKKYNAGLPDSIGITHNNFNFTIGLKRIER